MNFTWPNANNDEQRLLGAITILLGNNQKLLAFLFDPDSPRLRKRAGILKEDSWKFDESEQSLIRAALDIWSGSGHLQLWEMVETWEATSWGNFIQSIQTLGLEKRRTEK